MKTKIEKFSDKYLLLPDAQIRGWPRGYIAIPQDLDDQLHRRVGEPVFKLGTGHYRASAEHGIPAETVAVPGDSPIDDENQVLVARRGIGGDFIVQESPEETDANP